MRSLPASRLALSLVFAFAGCDQGGIDDGPPADAGPLADVGPNADAATGIDSGSNLDATVEDVGQTIDPDAGIEGPTIISGGDVSGAWCGVYEVQGNITIATTQTLTICGGSEVRFADGVGLRVDGTLAIEGASDSVRFVALGVGWTGVSVAGTLVARGIAISDAFACIDGRAGSSIDVDGAVLACNVGLSLGNGGIFRRVMVIGGDTVYITGGTFDIADSTIDLRHPNVAPDCTDWTGGSAIVDHVLFTGCHCPLHFNSADQPLTISNSILEGAVPVMIASSQATFTHNHLIGPVTFLDIGGPFTAEISGNYFGGGPPLLSSTDLSQFTGADDYSTTPFNDVGPR